jgi:hypothetical protein
MRGRPFEKGKSGNPGGRPKDVGEVTALARKHTREAIERLAQIMRSDNERAAAAACEALLNRGWGKPAQPLTGSDGGEIVMRVTFEDGAKG